MEDAGSPEHPFPVARSLVAVEPLARLLEAAYGLTEARCQLIKGTIRDTYLVSSRDGLHVLSIYRHGRRTGAEIEAELDVIEHLATGSVAVPPAVRRRTGERLLPINAPEGRRYAVLFRHVPGQHLGRQPAPEPARRYGQAIARAHVLMDELPVSLPRPRIDFDLMVDRPLTAFAAVVPQRRADLAYLHEAAAVLRLRIAALPTAAPGYGLVHGDVIPSNAQVTPAGEVAVLDFDFCGYGWRAYDVATYVGEVRFWGASADAAAAFLAGYEAVRPLLGWERAALPALEAARHMHALGTPAQNVNEWGSAYLADRLIDTLLANIRQNLEMLS